MTRSHHQPLHDHAPGQVLTAERVAVDAEAFAHLERQFERDIALPTRSTESQLLVNEWTGIATGLLSQHINSRGGVDGLSPAEREELGHIFGPNPVDMLALKTSEAGLDLAGRPRGYSRSIFGDTRPSTADVLARIDDVTDLVLSHNVQDDSGRRPRNEPYGDRSEYSHRQRFARGLLGFLSRHAGETGIAFETNDAEWARIFEARYDAAIAADESEAVGRAAAVERVRAIMSPENGSDIARHEQLDARRPAVAFERSNDYAAGHLMDADEAFGAFYTQTNSGHGVKHLGMHAPVVAMVRSRNAEGGDEWYVVFDRHNRGHAPHSKLGHDDSAYAEIGQLEAGERVHRTHYSVWRVTNPNGTYGIECEPLSAVRTVPGQGKRGYDDALKTVPAQDGSPAFRVGRSVGDEWVFLSSDRRSPVEVVVAPAVSTRRSTKGGKLLAPLLGRMKRAGAVAAALKR